MSKHVPTRTLAAAAIAMVTALATMLPARATFPDQGNRILFARAKNVAEAVLTERGGGGGLDLFTMKPNGEDQQRVDKTTDVFEYGGHWSPNGSRIVFTGLKGKGQADVYTTHADGTHRQKLTTSNDNFTPNWSRNGTQIVWTRLGALKAGPATSLVGRRGTGGGNLMVMNADGSDKHSLYSGVALSPGWSPTAGRIAFTTVDDDSMDIWTIKPNGVGLQQFTDYGVGSYTVFGDWAPDGDSFAFTWSPGIVRGGGSSFSLWVAPTSDPTDTVPIASDVSEIFAPVFTADGSRVVFVREVVSDYEVFSVKVDGTGEKQLTENAGTDILSVVPLF